MLVGWIIWPTWLGLGIYTCSLSLPSVTHSGSATLGFSAISLPLGGGGRCSGSPKAASSNVSLPSSQREAWRFSSTGRGAHSPGCKDGGPSPSTERATQHSPGYMEEGPALVHGGGSSPGCRPLRTQSWRQRAALDTEGSSLGRRYVGDSSIGVVADVHTHLVR